MSTVATPRRATRPEAVAPARALGARLTEAIPLASVYVWLCIVYLVEAWSRVTPWLFGDELELTQLSRSIAATGHAARRGAAHGPDSLYTYVIAPAWWISDTHLAYDAVKYIGVFVMTASVFPAYFLARLIVSRRPALVAAVATGAIPALAYSSFISEDTLAYPYAVLSLFLIAKALVARTRWWIGAAAVVSIAAPAVRGELAVVPVAFLLAALFMAWSSEAWRARRRTWSWLDWLGVVLLVLGAIELTSGALANHSHEWFSVTNDFRDRILDMGLWAVGAFAIGIGIVPMVAGLAALVRVPGEPRTRELRAFRSTAVAGFIAFGTYTGVKAAYLSTVFATRVEERNFIFVAPLLFVGTAWWLERRRFNLVALGAAALFTGYLIVGTPFHMDVQLYSDALGLAILQQGNRVIYWTPQTAQWVLLVVLVAGTIVLAAPQLLRGRTRRFGGALAAVVALFAVAWSLTGEIAAASGSNSISRSAGSTLRRPYDWVDLHTHGKPTVYLGQGIADQNGEWLMEFWNRSLKTIGSLDGTVGGPGPAGSPNIREDGSLYWSLTGNDPRYDYAVGEWPCVQFAGIGRPWQHAYRAGGKYRYWRLYRVAQPIRLHAMCTGIYADGWSGPYDSAYFQFSGTKAGILKILVSRAEWGGPSDPSPVHVLVGTLVIGKDRQPHIGKVTARADWTVDSGLHKVFALPTPGPRFAAQVIVEKKFTPQQISPQTTSDNRTLGAVVRYTFVPR
jgi:MFS family permease